MGNKRLEIAFGVFGGSSVATGSGAEILGDLKQIVSHIESSGVTKLKFHVDTKGLAKDIQKQVPASGSKDGYWQGRFKDSIKGMTSTNDELKSMGAYYKQLEESSDSFHKKNLTGIDLAIKTRETEGHQFATQLKAKMQAERTAAVESERRGKRETNSITQNTKLLNQAMRTYQKYGDSIRRVSKESGSSLDSDFNSFIAKMHADPKLINTAQGRAELALLEKRMIDMGATAETTWERLKRLFSAHLGTAVAMAGIHLLQQSIREIYQDVIQLDKALVDLQIATGYTRDQTKDLISDYSEFAKQLGSTTLEVTAAADGWLRQGYSTSEANTLIQNSMMLSKLGQIGSEEATVALTSAMKGYNLSVEDSIRIVDRLVSVDMKAAVSAGDIAIAMSKTATSARLAGVDMDRLAGYIASVSEVTQDGAESVGNFYKTLFARMGNIKAGNLIDPESAESLSDVETVLSGVGIKLRENSGEFGDFGDVLDDVNSKWDTYGTVQQRAIAVAFSGVRQQEKFLTLMEHYSEAMEYAGIATESTGAALDKYENTYLKGVEAAQNRAKASLEAFSTTLLDGDLVSGVFNLASGVLSFLNAILSLGDGVIVKIGLIAGSFKLLSVAGSKVLPLLSGLNIFKKLSPALAQYVSKLTGLPVAMAQIGISQMSLGKQVKLTTGYFLNQVKALGFFGKAAIAAVAIYAAVKVFDALIVTGKEHAENLRGLKEEYSEISSSLEGLNGELATTQARIAELQKLKNAGTINIVEDNELSKLKEANALLEIKIALLEVEKKETAKKKQEEAVEVIKGGPFDVQYDLGVIGNIERTEENEEYLASIDKYIRERAQQYQEALEDMEYYVAERGKILTAEQEDSNAQYEIASEYLDNYMLIYGDMGAGDILPIIFSRAQYKDAASMLEELSKKGELTADSIRDLYETDDGVKLLLDYLAKLGLVDLDNLDLVANQFNAIGEDAEDSAEKIYSLSEAISSLSKAKDPISSLANAFKELKDEGKVTFSTLEKIASQELFKDLPELDDYISTLMSANGNTEETNRVLTDMTYAALDAAMGTETLANSTEQTIEALLKENGIANANEVAVYAIAEAKAKLAAQTAITNGTLSDFIANLGETANASGYTKGALLALAAQMIATNNTGLSFSQQIGALRQLASAAFGAQVAMSNVFNTGGVNKDVMQAVKSGDIPDAKAGKQQYIQGLVDKFYDEVADSPPTVDYGGGSTGSAPNGSGSSKTVEEYLADIDKLYEATKRLKDIEYEINRLEAKSSITDDQQEQIENLNKIVSLYKEQQKTIAEIAELRRADIRDNIKELEAKGFEIAYDAANNDFLLKNYSNINKIVGKTTEETNELRKKYEDLIEATEDLNDANRDAADEWWDLEQKLNDVNKEYEDIISSAKDIYKATIDAIQKVIDKEKEALEIEKELFENQKSDLETTVDTVVSFIDKQIEALKEENDELDRQIEAQKKLEEIERAKNQRTSRVFKEGEGFVWSADQGAVNKAQQDYDEYKRKKALEDKVKTLEEYRELWQNITDEYQKGIDEQITADILGAKWQSDILAQKTINIEEYKNSYNHASNQLNEKTIGSVAYQIKQLDKLSDEWGDAYDEIEDAISDHKVNLDVLKDFENSNYEDRLALLKGYVSSAIEEINKLKEAQASATQATTGTIDPSYLAHMKANSEAWGDADEVTRQRLANENQMFGEALGLTYSSSDGIWYDPSGERAYSEGGVADFTGMAMLHGGNASELILNNSDAAKIYEYIHSTPSIIQDMISEVTAGRLTPVNSKGIPNASQNVSVNINGMHLHGVQDVDGFADAIERELPMIVKQKLFKNK